MNDREIIPHHIIIPALEAFGLPYDEKGVCLGISVLKSLSFLSKDKNFPLALQRIASIPPYTLRTIVSGLVMKGDVQEMVETKAREFAAQLKEKNMTLSDENYNLMLSKMFEKSQQQFNQAQQNLVKKGNSLLTEQEAATILAILETVSIAQFPEQFTELSPSFTTTLESADAVSQLLQPASLVPKERDEQGYEQASVTPIEKINFIKADKENLELLKNLRSVFKASLKKNEPVSQLITSYNEPFLHTVMLGYDPEKDEWTYEDPNKPQKIFQDENQLYEEILDSYLNDTSQEFLYYLYAGNPQTAKKMETAIPVYLADCSKLASGGAEALQESLNNKDYPQFIALLQKNASFAPKNKTLSQLNEFAVKLSLIERYYTTNNPQRQKALKNIQVKIMESYQLYLQSGSAMTAFNKLIETMTDIKNEVVKDHEKHGTFSNIQLFGKSFSLTSSELAGYIQTTLDEAIANRDSLKIKPK